MLKFSTGSTVRLLATLGVDLSTVAAVNFVFESSAPATPDTQGYEIDLSAATSQTRTATIVDAPSGQVQYTLTGSDLATPGTYRGQFQFTDGAGNLQIFPKTGALLFTVEDFIAPSQFSAVSDLVEPVRAIMGDFRTPYQYEDTAIESVVRSMVRLGHLPAFGVTSDGLSLVPPIVKACDLALLTYHSAKTLLRPNVRDFGWKTRALGVRKGHQRDFLFELQVLVYQLENPHMMTSFQSYYAWVNALAGINVWGLMSEMKVDSPVATVTIGTGGIQINTT